MIGRGEPLLVIQTALSAHELVPLGRQLAGQDRYQVITFTRRGYGASSPAEGPGSIIRDAEDCRAVLTALDVPQAHVLEVSYSAAVALELASASPPLVRSLLIAEPPPVHVASSPNFHAACADLIATFRNSGSSAALSEFMTSLLGANWREASERMADGEVARLERDSTTFLSSDIPALVAWTFTASQAARISAPVLYVGGTASGPWFAEVHEWVSALLPDSEARLIPGAGHDLALTHPDHFASIVLGFLLRHGSNGIPARLRSP